MKKICQCCGRNRKIGKFGKLSASADGKNYYCRECMRRYTKGYKCTIKGRIIQQSCSKKWKKNNKDVVKEYNRQYYKKNKARILYNKKAREETECVLIFENPKKSNDLKINKIREICSINIDPKRK